jgi:glycosyltransferase involved in cell wall biosynthesis
MFDDMSRAAKDAARRIDAPFVIQTQGLFNAYIEGRPLFVYTDYTELANLHARPGYKTNSLRWLQRERRLYEQAQLVFAASSDTRTSLVHDYGTSETKVVLTHTGLNVAAPKDLPVRDREKFDVLFVGVDWKRKGGPDVLRAFAHVRQHIPHASLTVVGCRPSGEFPPGVRFVGEIPPKELGDHFASASVFCLPAYQEPAGIAYTEAAAWGLPVVATTAGNIPDRVLHGRTGLLVEPGDVEGLTAALLQLARDPDLRARFGMAGRSYALENFSWQQIARVIAKAARPYLTKARAV